MSSVGLSTLNCFTIMSKCQSHCSKLSAATSENRGTFSPASDIETQIPGAMTAKPADIQGYFSQAISGVSNAGSEGRFPPSADESVEIQGPFSQASTDISEKQSSFSLSSLATSPGQPSPTTAGSSEFLDNSSTTSTGVDEQSSFPPLLQVFPESFTAAPEHVLIKMNLILDKFAQQDDLHWIDGHFMEPWSSVLEGVWRGLEGEDRFLEVPSGKKQYLIRPSYLEIYAVLQALWRGVADSSSEEAVLSSFITGSPVSVRRSLGFCFQGCLLGEPNPLSFSTVMTRMTFKLSGKEK
jgi:hypothetical protein